MNEVRRHRRNLILLICELPCARSYPALVTALVVTVSHTLLGYLRELKVTVYRTVLITCLNRALQERTIPSQNEKSQACHLAVQHCSLPPSATEMHLFSHDLDKFILACILQWSHFYWISQTYRFFHS